jgi:hypothetical protein
VTGSSITNIAFGAVVPAILQVWGLLSEAVTKVADLIFVSASGIFEKS